jgi:hypothetical protein
MAADTAPTDRRVGILGLALAIFGIPLLAVATFAAPRGEGLARFIVEHGWVAIAFGAISAFVTSLTVAWLVGLRAVLIEHSRRWLVLDCALIVGVFGFVTTLVAYPMLAGVAYTGLTGEGAEALAEIAFAVLNVGTGGATAISVAAFTLVIVRTGLRSSVVTAIGAVVVLAHTALTISFIPGDLLSPSGAIAWLAPLLYYAWVAAVSLWMLSVARA